MAYKKYVNGIAVSFAGFPQNNNAKSISKFGRQYPASQRVVSQNIPTKMARARIQQESLQYQPEDKAHFDLVRID